MGDVLDDIRLDEGQVLVLKTAAEQAGGELDESYAGQFAPAGPCLALRCISPGQLIRFAVTAAIADMPLAGQLAARACEDGPDRAGARVYYWPGVRAA